MEGVNLHAAFVTEAVSGLGEVKLSSQPQPERQTTTTERGTALDEHLNFSVIFCLLQSAISVLHVLVVFGC